MTKKSKESNSEQKYNLAYILENEESESDGDLEVVLFQKYKSFNAKYFLVYEVKDF